MNMNSQTILMLYRICDVSSELIHNLYIKSDSSFPSWKQRHMEQLFPNCLKYTLNKPFICSLWWNVGASASKQQKSKIFFAFIRFFAKQSTSTTPKSPISKMCQIRSLIWPLNSKLLQQNAEKTSWNFKLAQKIAYVIAPKKHWHKQRVYHRKYTKDRRKCTQLPSSSLWIPILSNFHSDRRSIQSSSSPMRSLPCPPLTFRWCHFGRPSRMQRMPCRRGALVSSDPRLCPR